MNKKEQIRFIKNLTGSIASELISKIESGRVPENWDGIELRKLLSDKFESESDRCFKNKRSRRYKDYNNIVIINNL